MIHLRRNRARSSAPPSDLGHRPAADSQLICNYLSGASNFLIFKVFGGHWACRGKWPFAPFEGPDALLNSLSAFRMFFLAARWMVLGSAILAVAATAQTAHRRIATPHMALAALSATRRSAAGSLLVMAQVVSSSRVQFDPSGDLLVEQADSLSMRFSAVVFSSGPVRMGWPC